MIFSRLCADLVRVIVCRFSFIFSLINLESIRTILLHKNYFQKLLVRLFASCNTLHMDNETETKWPTIEEQQEYWEKQEATCDWFDALTLGEYETDAERNT